MDWNYRAVNSCKLVFFSNQNFDFVTSNIVILLGIFSNLYLIFIYKKTQL